MKIRQIMALTGATVVCGNGREDHEVQCAFASDLMSDVLTLDCNGVLLVTGLCNMQTIRMFPASCSSGERKRLPIFYNWRQKTR